MIRPWEIEDRLTRWATYGSYVILATSVASWFGAPSARALPWLILIWLPFMLASSVKMLIETKRDMRFHRRVMKELEEHGTLDGLPGEDQERLNISAARWRLRDRP